MGRVGVVANLAVVVVLDEDCPMRAGAGDQCLTARDGEPATERVLVGGGGVDKFQPCREFAYDQAALRSNPPVLTSPAWSRWTELNPPPRRPLRPTCSMIFSDIGNILRLPRRAQWSSPPGA